LSAYEHFIKHGVITKTGVVCVARGFCGILGKPVLYVWPEGFVEYYENRCCMCGQKVLRNIRKTGVVCVARRFCGILGKPVLYVWPEGFAEY
jgi:hypothetical protein